MFTVESDEYGTEIVTLDDTGRFNDIRLIARHDNDTIYLTETETKNPNVTHVVTMSWGQIMDIVHALDSKDGTYRITYKERE